MPILHRHSACVVQGKIFIFGGWDTPVCFNDMYMLDLGKTVFLKNVNPFYFPILFFTQAFTKCTTLQNFYHGIEAYFHWILLRLVLLGLYCGSLAHLSNE